MDSRMIQLTAAAHKYGNLNICSCGRNFFPSDVFGGHSRIKGLGNPIIIKADGLLHTIKTDIPTHRKTGKPRWIFRNRAWVKEFVKYHKLNIDDIVTITRVDEKTYKVATNNNSQTSEGYLLKVVEKREARKKYSLACDGKQTRKRFEKNSDDVLPRLLRHDWSFSEEGGGNDVFSLHPYPAKFIPQIPRTLIKDLAISENTIVCDPFSGYGTTLIVAQEYGCRSVGIDLNPIACLISRVATRVCPNDLLSIARQCLNKAQKNSLEYVPPNIPNLDHWFKKPIQEAIIRLLAQIKQVHLQPLREALQLALSSIIVRVSNQDSDTRYAAVAKLVTGADVFSFFEKTCQRYAQVLRPKEMNLPDATVLNKDIFTVTPADFSEPVGLIICSPPYPNAYEYWLYHKYRMWWLGFDPLYVKEREIGARPHFFKKNGQGPDDFTHQMKRVFQLFTQICTQDAYVCFVLGNSKIHGQIIDNTKLLLEAASSYGFQVRAILPRDIALTRKSFNLAHSRIQTENIIVLQRMPLKQKTSSVSLYWHKYQYFPYEKRFALREIAALPKLISYASNLNKVDLVIKEPKPENLNRLVYFANYEAHGHFSGKTLQGLLENGTTTNGNGRKQSTRYSVHGLHEYKGKFNPQVVRGILNWFSLPNTAQIIDPFCGSGTAIVEAVFAGYHAYGWDLNPFATYLTNAKLMALRADPDFLHNLADKIIRLAKAPCECPVLENARLIYLQRWFPSKILQEIEAIKKAIEQIAGDTAPIFKVVLSNLLREYSFQEPSDLRIRRRITPLPTTPILSVYSTAIASMIDSLRHTRLIFPSLKTIAGAFLADGRYLDAVISKSPVPLAADFAITSPPYATALPYIDTQRLSLVWLDLISPENIRSAEESLIGSRETSDAELCLLRKAITNDDAKLPPTAVELCERLLNRMSNVDGFRRRAVPGLLYRYFVDMKKTFATVLQVMKRGGYYALIVGTNRTTIGGVTEIIDTPTYLTEIAKSTGWNLVESVKLETYNRYGIHCANAVQNEVLLVLRK